MSVDQVQWSLFVGTKLSYNWYLRPYVDVLIKFPNKIIHSKYTLKKEESNKHIPKHKKINYINSFCHLGFEQYNNPFKSGEGRISIRPIKF